MSSVIVPAKVCLLCAAESAALARRAKTKGLRLTGQAQCSGIESRLEAGSQRLGLASETPTPSPQTSSLYLLARRHDVRRRRPGVHDPDAALLVVVGQSGCLGGRAGNGDRHVIAEMVLVGAHHVIPHG